jgi:hypothetical protein
MSFTVRVGSMFPNHAIRKPPGVNQFGGEQASVERGFRRHHAMADREGDGADTGRGRFLEGPHEVGPDKARLARQARQAAYSVASSYAVLSRTIAEWSPPRSGCSWMALRR